MTELTDFQREITALLPEVELKLNEPMHRHTSFRIGGPAEVMAFPRDGEQLARILKAGKLLGVKPVILGAGTNVLAPDAGMPGIVVCLKDCMGGITRVDETLIRVGAGVSMARAAVFAAREGLSGLEFAHGIPGTIGGGVYMNAGAYGGEICQVCKRAEVMGFDGNTRVLDNESLGFAYRHSRLEETGEIVLWAEFQLTPAPEETIQEKMRELMARRRASQPLDLPSAGSAFKRPAGGYAAALIDQAGLKGYRVGDAAVSDQHAGFAVNLGQATAGDVKALLAQVSDIVFEKSGIRLEPEVRIW